MRRAAVVYTLARLVLFFLFAALIWSGGRLLGYDINGFLLLIVSLMLSSVAGFFLLAHLREALAQAVAERREGT